MKLLKAGLIVLLIALSTQKIGYSWPSESGGGVVSANEAIVRASLEATAVLQSDTSSLLYGTTKLGGATSYASYNSAGVKYTGSISTSNDVTWLSNNQYISWVTTGGKTVRTGLQANGIYLIDRSAQLNGNLSANSVAVASMFTTSINTTQILVSGNPTVTSTFTTGTCNFQFANGLLKQATC